MASPAEPQGEESSPDPTAELDAERTRRKALETENARLVAQIESYAEDMSSLYQERHGRGRGGLSAELSRARADLTDEAARGEVVGELYQKTVVQASDLTEQLVSYGQDLAKVRREAKQQRRRRGLAWPLGRLDRFGSIALLVGALSTAAAGAIVLQRAVASPSPMELESASPTPALGIQVVSSDPQLEAALAAARGGSGSAWATVTALAARTTPTAVSSQVVGSTAQAAPAAAAIAQPSSTATTSAQGWLATATALSQRAANAQSTAVAAQGTAVAAETRLGDAMRSGATSQGTVTALAADVSAARTTAAAARTAASTSAAGASTAIAMATAAGLRSTTAPASPMSAPVVSTPTAAADLRPTITSLAEAVEQVSAEGTVQAATATVFARRAGEVERTATAFALTATAPTATPTVDSNQLAPPKRLSDLERCSWEVPIPRLQARGGYFVEFEQTNHASVTVLWSAVGAMTLFAAPDSPSGRVVAEASAGDIVVPDLPPSTYRLRLENVGPTTLDASLVALFYDEMAVCSEPTGYADAAPVGAVPIQGAAVDVAVTPFVNCHPYVRAPSGFFQVQPRVWIDRARRIEGTWPLSITVTGPGVNLSLDIVAGPGRRPERIPLSTFGRYELKTRAIGVDLHENCNQAFDFDRTDRSLPTMPPPEG